MAQIFLFSVVFATASYGGQASDDEDIVDETLEEVVLTGSVVKSAPTSDSFDADNELIKDEHYEKAYKSKLDSDTDSRDTDTRSSYSTNRQASGASAKNKKSDYESDRYKLRTTDDKNDPRIERLKLSEEEPKAKSKEDQ